MRQICIEALQARLRSNFKQKSADKNGNIIYIDTDIFSLEMLNIFLDMSLSEFNQIPKFTNFSFDDEKFVKTFMEVLVEGATLYALASQALLERGREFQIVNSGITFDTPNLSEIMNTQYTALISTHFEKLKLIKQFIDDFDNS